jgi:hypothetical protein
MFKMRRKGWVYLNDYFQPDINNQRARGGSVDRMLGNEPSRKQSGKKTEVEYKNSISSILGTLDEESFIRQFLVHGSVLVLSRKDLDSQLASVYTSLSSRDWRRRMEVRRGHLCFFLFLISAQGLQLMRGLVTGGAGQMEELPGRLKYLEQPFECCVKNLRSQVQF